MDRLVIASDSRGRGIEHFMQRSGVPVTSLCIPGGKINALSTQINKLLKDSYTHTYAYTTHIIMVGGIAT